MQFRDLQRQYLALKEEIDQALCATAASGRYIMGNAVAILEEELARYVGVRHCITCANGTDALTLALKTLNIGAGDAVFVPDFTFFATAEVVALEGATPIFVDVCEDTFNISATSLEEAIKAVEQEGVLSPRAIIAVDLFGQPADYPALSEIARRHKLLLIEDGAQGFGGTIGKQRACSFGDIATTSFFPAKPLGCYGDGGAVFTNNNQWAETIRSLRLHGRGVEKYDNQRIGLNSRLDTIQAAILQVKLKAFIQHELTDIQTAAERYSSLLKDIDGIALPNVPEGYGSSWAQYTLRLESETQRDTLKENLAKAEIPSMIYYPRTLSEQTAFAKTKKYITTPTAHRLTKTVLSIPIHPYIKKEEIKEVAEKIQRSFHPAV